MTTGRKWVGLAAVVTVVLGGCSEELEGPPPEGMRYESVRTLWHAVLDAGMDNCDSIDESNRVDLAAQSADCLPDRDAVLAVYRDSGAVDDQIAQAKRILPSGEWLTGPNWTVNADKETLERLRRDMGGMIVVLG